MGAGRRHADGAPKRLAHELSHRLARNVYAEYYSSSGKMLPRCRFSLSTSHSRPNILLFSASTFLTVSQRLTPSATLSVSFLSSANLRLISVSVILAATGPRNDAACRLPRARFAMLSSYRWGVGSGRSTGTGRRSRPVPAARPFPCTYSTIIHGFFYRSFVSSLIIDRRFLMYRINNYTSH